MKISQLIKKIALFALIAAMALSLAACGDAEAPAQSSPAAPEQSDTAMPEQSGDASAEQEPDSAEADDGGEQAIPTLGEGETVFTLEIVHSDGETKTFSVSTDAETVGAALLELEMLDGESSSYGLYVKTVDGETLDYDTDGKYWGFYVDGAYAAAGVDMTAAENGVCYSFRAE